MTMNEQHAYPFADLALARRLERTEAKSNADFVDARASINPASGAGWIEVDGAYALFDGVGSPLTQTFGLGVFSPPTEAGLTRIEEFFRERGAEVFHEVCPLADLSVLALLNARGYQPVELSTVLVRPVGVGDRPHATHSGVTTRVAARSEAERWAEVAAMGWAESAEASEFMKELGAVTMACKGATPFFAEVDGTLAATGNLNIHDGIALFAGASTVPEFRKRGAQSALLDARLRYAAERGCDLAMMVALPGSGSQKNAERAGFRVAYTRIKWHRAR